MGNFLKTLAARSLKLNPARGVGSVDVERGQAGTAITEFALALPFLVAMLMGVIDITFALKEYYYLTGAVSAGAQRAMTAPQLVSGTDYASGTRAGCVGSVDKRHELIHERVSELISLHNRRLTDLCVISRREAPGGGPNQNTVLVQVVASYQGWFPLFDGLAISSQVRVPYLLG